MIRWRSCRRGQGRLSLAALAAAVTLGTAGCGTHPGVAAVVAGEPIDVQTVDQIAASYCAANRLASAQQGGNGRDQATRELRRGVLNALIQTEVVQLVAQRLGGEVPAADVENEVAASIATLPRGLARADEAQIKELLYGVTRSQLLTLAIGEQLLGATSAGGQDRAAAFARGRQYVARYAAKLDVEVDPRYGAYTVKGLAVQSGSLSVPVSGEAVRAARSTINEAWASRLPASQTCG